MSKTKQHKEYREYVLHLIPVIKLGYQDIKVSGRDFIDGEQGCYRAEQAEILIKEGAEGRELLNTVIHEILHAVCYIYGLKKEFKDDEQEEKIVNALANGMTEALVRNPELFKMMEKLV